MVLTSCSGWSKPMLRNPPRGKYMTPTRMPLKVMIRDRVLFTFFSRRMNRSARNALLPSATTSKTLNFPATRLSPKTPAKTPTMSPTMSLTTTTRTRTWRFPLRFHWTTVLMLPTCKSTPSLTPLPSRTNS